MKKQEKSYYYNVENDMERYPDAWAYIIVGGRNCGKTYSALKSCYVNKRDFIFIKRTIEDVDMLCAGSAKLGAKQNAFDTDLSPFKSINRDIGSNVRAFPIKTGIGAFYECDSEGQPGGKQLGLLLGLNAVSKFKGFDMASSGDQWLIFDEFIPQKWDRVNRKEGEQVMEIYKTISRDREHRGLKPLKLVALANAVSISNPLMNMLEVTDYMANMFARDQEYLYIEERGILLHQIKENPEFAKVEKNSLLYKAMGNTAWGQVAFDNVFAYDDFMFIGRTSLKGYTPVCSFSYKRENWYIWQKNGKYYFTKSRHNRDEIYNLNRESEAKLFWQERGIMFRLETIAGNCLFETYTAYDIILNFKKVFQVQ